MKIEWFVDDVTAVWGWFQLGAFLGQFKPYCGQEATLWCKNPLLSRNNITWGHLMKMQWIDINITASGSPDRAERAILGVVLATRFLANSGRIWGRGATLWCKNPLLSSNNFTQGHLMKIEWLVTNVTGVRSPDRTCFFGVILARLFSAVQAVLVVREAFYGVGTPSWALRTVHWVIQWK